MAKSRRHRQRGGSALEMAFLLPWYIFLFVGAFDWGFYAHALISTESAARVAAIATSASNSTAADSTLACTYALEELRIVSNIGSTTTCSGTPVTVTATKLCSSGCTSNSADGNPASQVAVTYTTQSLIPIPMLLAKQATFYRVVQMRLRS
ncbi:MAG TPA: TadE/TadG family type IV pilus assembly protein [Bryobacteraceae bacterium]